MSDTTMEDNTTQRAGTLTGALGWAGIACVAGGVIVRLAMPAREAVWYWALVAGIVLILLYGVTQWREVAGAMGRRQARYGALAGSSILIAIGILVAINFVLARQNRRWDLTAARQYSLAPQTVQILESLDAPVRMLVFAQDIDFPRYRDRLSAYEYASSQVTLEYVDPDRNPTLARQYEVQAYGTVVLEYDDRVERVVSDEEQALTNALIKVIEGEEQRVYFVQGHGERVPEGTDRDGYGSLGEALRLDNLAVETVVIAQTGEVPPDASVLVVAGPTTDYLPAEIEILGRYLESGGKLLVMLDPPDDPALGDRTNLIDFVAAWGVEVGDNVVVDVSGVGQLLGTDATVPLASSYPPHPITADFQLLTAFPFARSVSPITGGVDGRQAEVFAETSAQSWAETSHEELQGGEVTPDEDDPRGPIAIGVAVAVDVEPPPTSDDVTAEDDGDDADGEPDASDEAETEEEAPRQARLAVIGDSDFASNAALGIQGNRDLALNVINWLAEQENLISIRPREPEDRRITITAIQQRNIFWLSLFIVPAGVIGTGVYTWWRRR